MLKKPDKLLTIIAPNNHSKKLAFTTNFYSFLKRLIVDLFKLIKCYFLSNRSIDSDSSKCCVSLFNTLLYDVQF